MPVDHSWSMVLHERDAKLHSIMKRRFRDWLLKLVSQKLLSRTDYFELWERYGYHVTPNHFTQPIPDTSQLNDRLWDENSQLAGIDMNEAGQLNILDHFTRDFKQEYELFPVERQPEPAFFVNNGIFESVDAEVAYCMIRRFKPRCIVEIGAGYSTVIMNEAIKANASQQHEVPVFHSIEPYPRSFLHRLPYPWYRLTERPLQDVPLIFFDQLGDDGLLFIDSSHVLKIGSDVQYEVLELLPRLRPGCIVHIHDIFLPSEYPKEWVKQHQCFWNEQYFIQAFLTHNSAFNVLWASSYMHINHPDSLEAAFRSYDRNRWWPASLWLQRVR